MGVKEVSGLVSGRGVIWSVALSLTLHVLNHHLLLVLLPLLCVAIYKGLKAPRSNPDTAATFFSGLRVGGHRGSPTIYPENSMASFEQAKLDGCDLVEFDVSMTKDGHAVLLHDDNLDRTTNMTGPIRDKNLAELKDCNIAAHFKRTGPGSSPIPSEGLPALETLVSWAKTNKMKLLFDVKDYDPELTAIIVELFTRFDLYDSAIVCSFFPWVVYRVKKADSRILTGMTWRQKFFSYEDGEHTRPRFSWALQFYLAALLDVVHHAGLHTILPTFLGVDLMLTSNSEISPRYVAKQRAKGVEVMAWTVNDINEMHWMLETLKIPILTDLPYHIQTLSNLRKFGEDGYVSVKAA
ncbi:unnamed protein product, partial [Mesorhabditis spiculigera]